MLSSFSESKFHETRFECSSFQFLTMLVVNFFAVRINLVPWCYSEVFFFNSDAEDETGVEDTATDTEAYGNTTEDDVSTISRSTKTSE